MAAKGVINGMNAKKVMRGLGDNYKHEKVCNKRKESL